MKKLGLMAAVVVLAVWASAFGQQTAGTAEPPRPLPPLDAAEPTVAPQEATAGVLQAGGASASAEQPSAPEYQPTAAAPSTTAPHHYPGDRVQVVTEGTPQVIVNVTVAEISLTKLRSLGIDIAHLDEAACEKLGLKDKLPHDTNPFTAFISVQDAAAFLSFTEALKKEGLMRVLAAPHLVTLSGRPATFECCQEVQIAIANCKKCPDCPECDSEECPACEKKCQTETVKIGTHIDCVSHVFADQRISLEIRLRERRLVASTDADANEACARIRAFELDTATVVEAGKTVILGTMVQHRTPACSATDAKAEEVLGFALVTASLPTMGSTPKQARLVTPVPKPSNSPMPTQRR